MEPAQIWKANSLDNARALSELTLKQIEIVEYLNGSDLNLFSREKTLRWISEFSDLKLKHVALKRVVLNLGVFFFICDK